MGPCLSWTHWRSHSLTSLLSALYIESPHIQICNCNGTVTTTWLLNIVSLTPCHTDPKLSAPILNYLKRKKTTSEEHSEDEKTLVGLKSRPTSTPTGPIEVPTILEAIPLTTPTSPT